MNNPKETAVYPMRINKYLAHKKHATRLEADEYIKAGKVLINGKKAVLGDKVTEEDNVEILFKQKSYRYFAYNKARGIITHSPQEGEKDIHRVSPVQGVFPIGRLDKDSQGLIILTDDGRVTDKLLNPDYVHEKQYVVTTKEDLPSNLKSRMERGVKIEGYMTKPAEVNVLSDRKFSITLTEGKKHQIRRMCAALDLTIAQLERRRIMNIKLGDLRAGEARQIVGKELSDFLIAIGL